MASSGRLPRLPGLGSCDRTDIVEAKALNNLGEDDLEEEVMAKVTCRANQLLASRDYTGLSDKQKTWTRT